MCNEDICFNCNVREECDHVSHRDIWDCNCKVATTKEYDSQSIAEIAYDKLFDRFRGKEVI